MTDPHGTDGTDLGGEFGARGLLARRHALKLFAGAGLLVLAGCAGDDSSSSAASTTAGSSSASTSTTPTTSSTSTSTSTTAAAATGATEEIPDETAGPYPGDGSNGPNVLTQDGVVRQDIRSSFGSMSGTAEGVPLAVRLRVVDASTGRAISGAAVYAWHCDREGRYSLYSQGVTNQNYLRGVQVADSNGDLSFTTVFPGAYSGRWPHIHFEVYDDVAAATSAGADDNVKTSQLALPEDVCDVVYAADGYSASVRNMAQMSLSSDNVFRDGWDQQMATVSGSVANGYTAELTVAV